MDLLIMEDLFHKQDISRTFDLKGIGTYWKASVCVVALLILHRGEKSSESQCANDERSRRSQGRQSRYAL